jgi:ABC-type branched-subunit amino acid transport system substrate-binding protein
MHPFRAGRGTIAPLALAVALAVTALTGCGRAGVRSGPGVTDTTITLGVLTDLSGPFAPAGRALTAAARAYTDQLNGRGGVCGRTVQLEVRDHGYDTDRALGHYADLQPRVLGFEQLLGSPMTSALLPRIAADQVLTAPASSGSALLHNPYVAVMGATYDVEMIDGLEYLRSRGLLSPGDAVGHVYLDSDYGLEAALGSRYAASQLGLRLTEIRLDPAQLDVSAQVAQLLAAKVRAVLVTTGPQQTAALVGAGAAAGLTAPVIGNNPTYLPALLRTPAGPALQKLFMLVGPSNPVSAGGSAVTGVLDALRAAEPALAPDSTSIYGWAVARAYVEVLRRACAAGDLSRAGVAAAFRRTEPVSTDGLLPDLDFSRPGSPPTRQVFISRPDPTAAGGLTLLASLFSSPLARLYQAPAESGRR